MLSGRCGRPCFSCCDVGYRRACVLFLTNLLLCALEEQIQRRRHGQNEHCGVGHLANQCVRKSVPGVLIGTVAEEDQRKQTDDRCRGGYENRADSFSVPDRVAPGNLVHGVRARPKA